MELILLLLVVLVVVVAVISSRFMDNNNPYPFTKKPTLFTQVERSFLTLMERAVGNEYKIMNRVKLTDIVIVKPGVASRAKRAAMLAATSKTIDYVLVDKDTLSIVAAVDLVNNQRPSGHKAKRDWFVTGALESAGIPHVRIKVKPGYKAKDIRDCIDFKIGKKARLTPRIKGNIPRQPVAALSLSQVKAQKNTNTPASQQLIPQL
ncbi:DUF2726 domain-containing protein [Flocculibacter collagenilyticus]|uniref:DUF2726 domain-containing protein n=1 Tax=Flocculibacter collagenilyticus TaxID=2744479 RepID=UPI0018F40A39|nr:DUF2726 domain-containing protein [Flocculibacter collagenilyticus]